MNNGLEIKNNLNLDSYNLEEVTYKTQKDFLESNLGKVINGGIDLGLKTILPDVLEDEIIEIKNSIITEGFEAGVKTAIDNITDMGKSVFGIFTGKFDNMSQVKDVIKKGGLIDSVSEILDWGINKAQKSELINKSTASLIKKGKNSILNTVNNNIEKNMVSQLESIEKIDKYIVNWNKHYKEEDFENMDKQYKKLEKELEKIMPLENVIIKAKVIENLHNLIKNNGNNFNLSNEEKELANRLV